jgi:hypothetical protein
LFRGIFSAGSFAVEKLTKERQNPIKESSKIDSVVNVSAPSSNHESVTNDAKSDALNSAALPSNATNLVPGLVQ